jgi:hypothetical protein
MLRDEGRLAPYQIDIVDKTFDWLNDHVPCPPFGANLKSGNWSPGAVAWFLPDAKEPIQRMWDLVAGIKGPWIKRSCPSHNEPGADRLPRRVSSCG